MKKYVLFLCLLALAACNSSDNDSKSFPVMKPDTVITPVILCFDNAELRLEYLRRIIRDTFALVDVDANTAVRKRGRDTSYQIAAIDTVRDAHKKPVRDSIGRYKMQVVTYYLFPKKQVVYDFNLNILSVIKTQ